MAYLADRGGFYFYYYFATRAHRLALSDAG